MVLTPEQLKEVDQKGVEICEVARGRTLEQPAESRVTALYLKFSRSSFKSGVSGEGRDSGDGESSLTGNKGGSSLSQDRGGLVLLHE